MITMYKYSEDKILAELKEYVDQTYGEHYSKNKFQSTEFIIDSGHGEGFCIGNIIHYAIIAIHNNDLEMNKNEVINTDQRSSKEL